MSLHGCELAGVDEHRVLCQAGNTADVRRMKADVKTREAVPSSAEEHFLPGVILRVPVRNLPAALDQHQEQETSQGVGTFHLLSSCGEQREDSGELPQTPHED